MGVDFSDSHQAMDARQHQDTYTSFVRLVLVSCVIVIMTLIGMALFLT